MIFAIVFYLRIWDQYRNLRTNFQNMTQNFFFRKFHLKIFRIPSNTILNTKRAKYEGLTPSEFGEKNLQPLSLILFQQTLVFPWFPIVFLI